MSEKVKGQKSPIMSVKEFVVHMLEVNKAHGTMADLAKRIGRSYQSTYTKLRSIQKKYPEIKLPKLANGKGQGKKIDISELQSIVQQYETANKGKALKIGTV